MTGLPEIRDHSECRKQASTGGWLLRQPALLRAAIMWSGMLIVMFVTFGVGLATHPDAWTGVPAREMVGGWPLLRTALIHNTFILLLIALGNLFARFGWFTPGLLILIIQALTMLR